MQLPSSIPPYNVVRINAPDSLIDETALTTVSVTLPRELTKYAVGVLINLQDPNFWYGSYAYTNQEIANIFAQMEFGMVDCASVADCIENNPDTQLAIQELINQYNNGQNNGGSNFYLGNSGETFSAQQLGGGCDTDYLFGMIRETERLIYDTASEVWTAIRANARLSVPTMVAFFIDLIPGIGDLPLVDDLNDLIDQFDTLADLSFELGYNEQIAIGNCCAVFDSVCNQCEFTLQAFIDRYRETSDAGAVTDLWKRIVSFNSVLTLPEKLVALTQLLVVETMASLGGLIRGILSYDVFGRIIRAADANPDWETLCNGCKPLPYEWAYEWQGQELYPFYPPPFDIYRLPDGLGQYNFSGGARLPLFLTRYPITPNAMAIIGLEVDWRLSLPGQVGATAEVYMVDPNDVAVIAVNQSGSGAYVPFSGTYRWDREEGDTTISLNPRIVLGNTPYMQNGAITRFRIEGTGNDSGLPIERRVYPPA